MRVRIDIRDLYRNRRQWIAQVAAGKIIDLEAGGQIIARIEPPPEMLKKRSPQKTKAAGLRTT